MIGSSSLCYSSKTATNPGFLPIEDLRKSLIEMEKNNDEQEQKRARSSSLCYLSKTATNPGFLPIEDLRKSLIELDKNNDEQEQKRAHLRRSLIELNKNNDEREQKRAHQSPAVLGQLGTTPEFMLLPPKKNLVEKYFQPDNMSSADKLKIELPKVRDKFKMSGSDCGSACVQVAHLTTKIKHLTSVSSKKDKHSRRVLQAMMQERKKLLKYLRRTDWHSYSLVMSKWIKQVTRPKLKTRE